MRAPLRILGIPAFWALAALAHGQDTDPLASAPPSQAAAERSWRIGVALGSGKRTNPLIQSEDIPVYVDLDIAWFGKRWFFDNGDVGFTLSDTRKSTTSLVTRVNSDRLFFGQTFTNTKYVTFAYTGNGDTATILDESTGQPIQEPIEVKVPERDYAIELGIESMIDGDWGTATLRAFHDVSGTHEGYELSALYSWRWISGRFSVAPTVGVSYNSDRLNDYYWGVTPAEASQALPAYKAGGGFGFEAGVAMDYHISRNLRIALSFNYEELSDEVAASPLAQEDYVMAYFTGLAWTF